MDNPKLTPERLQRTAIVYVRQSSPIQVIHHLESKRLQYALPARAQELGFQQVEVIDEDQGRSGSGYVERPGFERLVARVCAGEVGGILCMEASRLARNGRDWHHLLELCALVGTLIIDPQAIYDPSLSDDRMVLGLKGTMSEFEVSLFRQRSRDATQQKARRGELQFRLPVGLSWHENHIVLEPDQQIQQALRLVFKKIHELGSVRQVYLWFWQQRIQFPVLRPTGKVIWQMPRYSSIRYTICNPLYAGAYAFGRTQIRTRVMDGRARKVKEDFRRDHQRWAVLIRDHHPGYITWEEYERNQRIMDANAHMKARSVPKAGRGGRALLTGLVRCRRCGRLMNVSYRGGRKSVIRYMCRGELNHPEFHVSFGGAKAEQLVVQELLEAVSGNAVEAALQAAEQERSKQGEHRRALEMALEQVRYQARLAERRYEAVDPEQRLVAGELEARWNAALANVREAEARCREFDQQMAASAIPSQELLMSLAQDLPAVWEASSDMRLKQRILHLALREILADVDPRHQQVTLLLHWAGGRHSEVRWKKKGVTQVRNTAREVIGKMAAHFPDQQIAFTLNRQRQKTETGMGWSTERVAQIRRELEMAAYDEEGLGTKKINLTQAARRLRVTLKTVRSLVVRGLLPAEQIVDGAPWLISVEALESIPMKQAIARIRRRRRPMGIFDERQQSMFSDT